MNDQLADIRPAYSLVFERESSHSPERLWHAITDSEEVSRWMSYPARIDLRVGGDYFVDFSKTNSGELDGVIVRIEPGRLLRYAWGTSVVDWTLEPTANGCLYRFGQYGLPPREIPGEEGLVAGWHAWFEDFDSYLDTGRTARPMSDRSRWIELGKLYRPKLEAVVPLRQ